MVAITDYSIGRLRLDRRRLRRAFLVRLHDGEDVVELAPVVLRFLRVRRDLARCVARTRAVRCSSFNINSFSTEQALSLFRFKPADLSRVAGLLDVQAGSSRRRHKASAVEHTNTRTSTGDDTPSTPIRRGGGALHRHRGHHENQHAHEHGRRHAANTESEAGGARCRGDHAQQHAHEHGRRHAADTDLGGANRAVVRSLRGWPCSAQQS